MWQDLWDLGQDVTIYHAIGHAPLVSLGNDEADVVVKVRWLEGAPRYRCGPVVAPTVAT